MYLLFVCFLNNAIIFILYININFSKYLFIWKICQFIYFLFESINILDLNY